MVPAAERAPGTASSPASWPRPRRSVRGGWPSSSEHRVQAHSSVTPSSLSQPFLVPPPVRLLRRRYRRSRPALFLSRALGRNPLDSARSSSCRRVLSATILSRLCRSCGRRRRWIRGRDPGRRPLARPARGFSPGTRRRAREPVQHTGKRRIARDFHRRRWFHFAVRMVEAISETNKLMGLYARASPLCHPLECMEPHRTTYVYAHPSTSPSGPQTQSLPLSSFFILSAFSLASLSARSSLLRLSASSRVRASSRCLRPYPGWNPVRGVNTTRG